METPMMPFAPSRPLFGVPSRSRIAWSTAAGSANDFPTRASAISPLTLPTAVSTPLPPYRDLSPSRNSTASLDPVDAPDGTPARAVVPVSYTHLRAHETDSYLVCRL